MNSVDNAQLPKKELKKIRDRRIKSLDREGFNLDQIAVEMKLSKSAVFYVINGRTKKTVARILRNQKIKAETEKLINKNISKK